ncbi:hypothetical protein EUX98_g7091 [Antrodiella citrinella]|uniref:Zn(2)-C6 fungal-type domain-containing protein n=1 Tax=Antrodiella citrinella TaxID=2447956 RepID=A0A4V3XI04_9APHY|nr:hypothetical protein EUX98_g7091 [Antrodiella citrinella]
MAFFNTHYEPQHLFYNYDHHQQPRQPPHTFDTVSDTAPHPPNENWHLPQQQGPESTLAHALDDLHVSYEPRRHAPDPNTFYEYREVLRHPKPEYEHTRTGPSAFPVADPVPCMDTAQVPCAEYGESYCSDDDSPYGALASPLLPYDPASPFTDVVDSPTADFADAYVDTVHSPIHYNSQSFIDRPVVPSRSYTLDQAVTLSAPIIPDRSPSLADTKRSASASTSFSETTGSSSSPYSSASPVPSSKASTPLSITSTSTSSNSSGKPRGRPRKRQNNDAKPTSPPRIVDYPFPKFEEGGSSFSSASPSIPTPPIPDRDTRRVIAPKPEAPVQPPPVLSMDEIPIPDAESKPGQAIFKLNTPPEIKEKPKKKPILACLFCRERKIACGQPLPGSTKCNQCARRGLDCEFPKESRRGQHKRGPRAARVAALTEAALSAKRPLEPAPSSSNVKLENFE